MLLVRMCWNNMKGLRGLRWPESGRFVSPTWDADPASQYGLFAWELDGVPKGWLKQLERLPGLFDAGAARLPSMNPLRELLAFVEFPSRWLLLEVEERHAMRVTEYPLLESGEKRWKFEVCTVLSVHESLEAARAAGGASPNKEGG